MFLGLFKDEKFFPTEYVDSVFAIDYNKLYARGIRLILTDLDNTLISYRKNEPDDLLNNWITKRKEEGFEVIIVSNNSHKKRVRYFAKQLNIPSTYLATKPLKCGMKRAIKKASRKYTKQEIVTLGDQLMTDIFVANRMNIYSILVKAIDRKTEILPTKLNRQWEKHVLKHLKKKYPDKFATHLASYYEEYYGKK